MKSLDDEKVSDNTTGERSRKRSSKLDFSNPSLNHYYLEASYADEDSRTTNRPKSSGGDVHSSSANKGKQEILVQMRAPKLKKDGRDSFTESKSSRRSSSLVFNSQDTSAEDVSQGHEHLAATEDFDHLFGPNDSDQAESANISSELTSEYASSSVASGGANGGEVRRHIDHVVKGKMKTRSAPSYSEHNQNGDENNIDTNQTSCRSDDALSEARDSCSVSDIDEIIRRAKRALESTAESSSSSDEFSFFGEIKRVTRHHVANNTAADSPQSKKNGEDDSPSIGNSSKSSDSFTGLASLSTACLEGITSDVNVGDGGFSSASSGWENASKDTDGTSSARVEGVEKSSKVDIKDQNEKSPPQGDSGIEHETSRAQFAGRVQEFEGSSRSLTSLRQTPLSSPRTALTSFAQSNSKPIDISSVLNTPQYRYEEVRHMLPVHLDYSLLTRMDKVLTSSHESLQMLKEWDKKLGLMPSHSKTMTQSARSRKKLHTNIKRMIKKLDALEKK